VSVGASRQACMKPRSKCMQQAATVGSANLNEAIVRMPCDLLPAISVGLSASAAKTDQGKSVTITAMVKNDPSGSGVSWSLIGPGSLASQSPNSVAYVAPAPSTISIEFCFVINPNYSGRS